MNSWIEKLKKAKHLVRLEKEQKSRIREMIAREIEADAVLVRAQPFFPLSFFRRRAYAFAAALAVVFGAAGISSAAEGTVPGDTLYPVKIHLNENLRSALSLTSEAKAEWETRRVERRLEEAAELSREGRLDIVHEAQLGKAFEDRVQAAEGIVRLLEAEGKIREAADAASRLEVALKAQKKILKHIREEGEERGDELEANVSIHLEDAKTSREDLEARVKSERADGVRPVIEAGQRVEKASRALTTLRAYLKRNEGKLDSDTLRVAEGRLQNAENLLTDAEEKIRKGEEGEAFSTGNSALRVAEETEKLLKAKATLNLKKFDLEDSDLREGDDKKEGINSPHSDEEKANEGKKGGRGDARRAGKSR